VRGDLAAVEPPGCGAVTDAGSPDARGLTWNAK
jgi:hypothetical protein